MLNKLLLRQITKSFGDTDKVPEELYKLFQVISDSYDHYEKDRKMLERSIELTSKEMIELNNKLRKETEEESKLVFDKLKESLSLLKDDNIEFAGAETDLSKLSNLADLLKEETKKRRVAEKERAQRESHLEASQRIAHIGSWELDLAVTDDLNANQLHWSAETYRIFGFEPGLVEVSNELFFSRVHPDDVELVKSTVARSLKTGDQYDVDHRLLLPDGTEKIVREIAEVFKDHKTGQLLKMVGTVQDITERVRSQQDLERINEALKTLFENISEVYYSVDMTNYTLLQMSNACEEVYGYTVEEFKQNPNLWLDVILEEDKHIVIANQVPMQQGKTIEHEYRIHHKNGETRWVWSKLKPTLGPDGTLIRLDGISADVSKRKEAELALKESEHKFRSLIEHSADAIMVVDENSVPTYASDSLYRIMGYTPEEVIGVRSLKYIHQDDLPLLEKHLERVRANPGKPFTVIYRRIKKDGGIIWCEGVAINFLHDPAIKGVVVNFRDITERVKTERALRNSESKFRSLIENSSDVITVADEDMNIVFVSDSIYRMTGFLPEEILGLKSMLFSDPEEYGKVNAFTQQVLSNPGIPQKLVYKTLKKDGTTIWCERVTTNLLHDPAINGIVTNFRDITEQYKYEQALRESNEILKKTNMELDRFVYSVSHDLRAPLSSMLGVIEFAETETTDPEMLEHLSMLKKSARKLDGFVVDILNYSRNARVDLESEKIDFTALVRDVVNDIRHMNTGNSNVQINIQVDDDAKLYSDKARIKIILSNLVSNAIRYHDPQKAEPFVKICVYRNEGGIDLCVEDNGIGINADKHEKIFDMFYRVSKKSDGTGIGLYIVKETVEKLKGTIRLHSELEKGSEFIIHFPTNIN